MLQNSGHFVPASLMQPSKMPKYGNISAGMLQIGLLLINFMQNQ